MKIICNCENTDCRSRHEPGQCQEEPGLGRVMYLGRVCDRCYSTYPDKYKILLDAEFMAQLTGDIPKEEAE